MSVPSRHPPTALWLADCNKLGVGRRLWSVRTLSADWSRAICGAGAYIGLMYMQRAKPCAGSSSGSAAIAPRNSPLNPGDHPARSYARAQRRQGDAWNEHFQIQEALLSCNTTGDRLYLIKRSISRAALRALSCGSVHPSRKQRADVYPDIVGPQHDRNDAFPERQMQKSDGEEPCGKPDAADETVLLNSYPGKCAGVSICFQRNLHRYTRSFHRIGFRWL